MAKFTTIKYFIPGNVRGDTDTIIIDIDKIVTLHSGTHGIVLLGVESILNLTKESYTRLVGLIPKAVEMKNE